MFIELWLTVFIYAAVLYVPGFLFFRALSCNNISAFLLAPIFSITVYVICGIAFYKAGLHLPAWSLAIIAIGIGICALIISLLCARIRNASQKCTPTISLIDTDFARPVIPLLVYIAISLVITIFVFVANLPEADSLGRFDDSTFHISLIRGYLDTETYSIFNATSQLNRGLTTGFYPAAFHVCAAIVASTMGENVTLSCNAAIIALNALIIPTSIFALISVILPHNRKAITSGALFACSIVGYSWGYVINGQYLANFFSLPLIPLLTAIFLKLIYSTYTDKGFMRFAVVFVLGIVATAVAHPNGIFTFAVIGGLALIWRMITDEKTKKICLTPKRIIAALALLVIAIVAWIILYKAPFLQATIMYEHPPEHSASQALANGILFYFTGRMGVQLFATVALCAGLVCTILKPKYLWLSLGYLFALFLFVISDSRDGAIQHFLTGFWYTDPYRTASLCCLFAIPLCAFGFAGLVSAITSGITKLAHSLKSHSLMVSFITAIVLTILLVASNFAACAILNAKNENRDKDNPNVMQPGLVAAHNYLTHRYSWENWLTKEEDAFVRQAMDIVPEGVTVANVANDGSEWSYGYEGLNTLYRRQYRDVFDRYPIVREHLSELATSEEVQRQVKDLGIGYVLLLDDKTSGNPTIWDYLYNPDDWAGIESITEDTPGFELVLSEEDMRLYKIDDKYLQ